MPGVLLIKTMAQTSGWLMIGLTRFDRMPFLAAVKEAKLRTFVTPGHPLSGCAALVHEGSGYAITKASVGARARRCATPKSPFGLMVFPTPISA